MLNYKHETHALSHSNLSIASFKCTTQRIVFNDCNLAFILVFAVSELWLIRYKINWACSFYPRGATTLCCHRVSVCPSVTNLYCIKTAKHRISKTMPHDSPGSVVLWYKR